MSFDTRPFRQKYRANIAPSYNPWLHAGFVLVFGLAVVIFLLSQLNQVSIIEWLTVPATLIWALPERTFMTIRFAPDSV